MIWKELFDVKKPQLSEAEELALSHSKVIEKQIEACRFRLKSIEVLLGFSSRDALILCRHLHGDLRSALETMHSGNLGSKEMNPDTNRERAPQDDGEMARSSRFRGTRCARAA